MSLLSNVSTTSGRILVVDDDAGARDLIVSSLRADGHDVDASGSGFEALRLLGRQCYDLVVSNLMMPELDGPSLYSAVTHRWPISRPHFLFVSGLGNTSAIERFTGAASIRNGPFGNPFGNASLDLPCRKTGGSVGNAVPS